jgi:hypothetical protein
MKKSLLALAISVAAASGAWACSCMRADPAQQIAESDAAFLGRVLSVKRTDPDINRGDVVARVRILKSYKGVRRGRIVTVKTGPNSAMCGIDMAKGDRISVTASRDRQGAFRTGLCSMLPM